VAISLSRDVVTGMLVQASGPCETITLVFRYISSFFFSHTSCSFRSTKRSELLLTIHDWSKRCFFLMFFDVFLCPLQCQRLAWTHVWAESGCWSALARLWQGTPAAQKAPYYIKKTRARARALARSSRRRRRKRKGKERIGLAQNPARFFFWP
jgi:hypothetical protein